MGFFDDLSGSGDSSTQKYLQDALKQYQQLQAPTVDSGKLNGLPEETVQGTVTPEKIAAIDQDPSAYNDIHLDPTSRQSMLNALQGFQSISDEGGLDANAKLGIQQVIDATNRQSQGAQGAIQQQAQAMGQGGGDFALTQRAIAAQGASNNAATQGLQKAAEAEANREAALGSMATIGGSINASDYGQAATKAAAQNAVNAANQNVRNAASTGNVTNDIAGQEFNVANKQAVNANNTAAGRNDAYYNANLAQQKFNNELAKANGVAGVNTEQAKQATASTAANNAALGKLAGTAGTVIGGMYGGPAGAAIGGTLGSAAVSNGSGSTPTGANADKSRYGLADGGVVCYAKGGMPHDHTICMKMGGHIGGEAEVAGDSEQNDTVPAMLSPGELVIPRSVPKTGPAMEEFARQAPVAGTNKKVDLTSFVKGYKRSR